MFNSTLVPAQEPALHYLIRQPQTPTSHPPLLILLHGVGSNEADLFSFAAQLPPKYLVISARAPIVLGGDSYAWYHIDFANGKPVFDFQESEKSRAILIRFIEEMKSKYSPNGECYLMGFSQGAIMSYSIGLTRPDLVNGIAVMSGRLLEEIKPLMAAPEKRKSLRVFISHGTADPVLQVQYAREAAVFLQSQGMNPVVKEYPSGHTISPAALTDVIHWLP